MVATDKAQHIMDLIKIDAEKMSNSNMSSNSNNGTPNGSQ